MAKKTNPNGPRLAVETVAVADLRPDPRNARAHPERNVEAIAASLRRFGQQKPIVALRDGTVIAGNGTLEAARRLEWETLQVAYTDLNEREAILFGVADNKTSDLAEWDFQQLASLLRDMTEDELPGTGFADFEVEPLLQADWSPPQLGELPEHSPDPGRSVHFGEAEWERVEAAVARVRQRGGMSEVGAAAAVALICEEWTGA